ncbi:O-antigen ligase family protein [Candidatus Obscuribacterales bacterium]|nr:O-antigen ligase family protein [Candidatus Obscuribacterales bacterium]
MNNIHKLYEITSKLEEWVILVYAVAVYLPITYSWIVLIAGMVVFVARVGLELAGVGSETSNRQAFLSCPSVIAVRQAPLSIPLLVFTIVVMVTGTLNGGLREGWASVVTLRAFLLYFIAYAAFSRSVQLRQNVLSVLLSFGAVAGIWGTIQQLFHFHPFEKFQYLQASGFMGNPMAYAGQMEVTACLALALLLSGGFKQVIGNRLAFSVLTVCNLAGVYFASERSAWLGILVGVLVIACLVSLRMFGLVLLSMIPIGLISWFTVPVVQTRIVPMLTNIQGDVGVQARFVVWQKAMEVWREHPMFGVGLRNFPKLDIPEAAVPGESTYLVHAHNNFLHILATMGIVGLLAFLYLELSMLWLSFKTWHSKLSSAPADLLHRAIGLGCLGGIVSLTVAGLFEYNFGTGHVRLMHWFVLAMMLVKTKTESNVGFSPGKAFEAPGGE